MSEVAKRVIHMGEIYPSAYEQGYAHGKEDGLKYSHRNGETEPPTESGQFWFRGAIGREDEACLVDVEESVLGHSYWRIEYWAASRLLSDAKGEWWGPVVPPWVQP